METSAFEYGWSVIEYDDLGVDAEHPDYEDEQMLRQLMEETGSDQVYNEECIDQVVIEGLHQDWSDLANPEVDEMFFEWIDWGSMAEHIISTQYKAVYTDHNGIWCARKR